ncbi:hypothetical protein AA0243_1963 [Novacetimonas hansenii NRIC 0243]|nr:hypothetical protein AA0243_1963 [Novacetimonas hansenii NRIC 0243]
MEKTFDTATIFQLQPEAARATEHPQGQGGGTIDLRYHQGRKKRGVTQGGFLLLQDTQEVTQAVITHVMHPPRRITPTTAQPKGTGTPAERTLIHGRPPS